MVSGTFFGSLTFTSKLLIVISKWVPIEIILCLLLFPTINGHGSAKKITDIPHLNVGHYLR
jgi:hypothetical protein